MEEMFKGRVVVVTGAGNGLGRAEAIALGSRGAKVIVNDIGTSADGFGASGDPADKVVEQIKQAGGKAVACYESVATEDGAKKVIQTAIDKFGRLDILVNNAGVLRAAPIYDVPTADWDIVIKTHLFGTFYCTRAACNIMKKQGYGRIISTSSHCGLGLATNATYSAAKEGITGLARSVARDMAKFGVTSNIIRPIAAWRGRGDSHQQMSTNQPEDVAALVVYLASEQAGNVNGCIFEVWHGHVSIFVEPPPVEQVLWKDGRWTPEELVKVMPETLTRGKTRENLPSTFPDFLREILK